MAGLDLPSSSGGCIDLFRPAGQKGVVVPGCPERINRSGRGKDPCDGKRGQHDHGFCAEFAYWVCFWGLVPHFHSGLMLCGCVSAASF